MSVSELIAPFHKRLFDSDEALAYLSFRLGQAVDILIELFHIGKSPREWATAMYFRDRITVPMWASSDPVGFRGVTYTSGDHRPKGVPWPPSQQAGADPLGVCPETKAELEEQRFCVVVEGELDMLTLWGCGVPAVASCTSAMSDSAAQRVAALVDCALIWADNDVDDAGIKGAKRTAVALKACGVETRTIVLTNLGFKDVNDLYRQVGPEAVRRVVSGALADDLGPLRALI